MNCMDYLVPILLYSVNLGRGARRDRIVDRFVTICEPLIDGPLTLGFVFARLRLPYEYRIHQCFFLLLWGRVGQCLEPRRPGASTTKKHPNSKRRWPRNINIK